MKILHTNFHRGWGGQSNRILIVCRELVKRGHDVTIAAPPGSELCRRAAAEGLSCFEEAHFVRGFRPLGIWRDVRALLRLMKKRDFDVVHTHGSQDSWAVAYSMPFLSRKPLVLRTKHNIFPVKDHFPNRWLYGRATDVLVCISRAIMEYCRAKPYLRNQDMALIHSAVRAERFKSGRAEAIRREFGISGRYVAGMTGRLRHEKGHKFLIEALALCRQNTPDLVMLIVGTGSLQDQLRQQVRDAGLEDRVIFTGFRKDIPDILAALDLFIMPSVSEGLGTSVLEACAAGRCVVASRVGGIPDIIEDGKRGLLVEPEDPRALSEAIAAIYGNPAKARDFAVKAREWVTSHFSEESMGEKTEEAYRRFLKKKRSDSPL